MSRFGYILIFIVLVFTARGQEPDKLKLDLKLDILTSHILRGFKNGNSYSIQPTISLGKKSWTTGVWAAYAGDDSYFEVDLFVEYTYNTITFSLYDYYCPTSTQISSFVEFRKKHTQHTLDAMCTWKPKRIPIKVLASTMIWGDDLSSSSGKQVFSTYFEPAFIWKWKAFSGDIFFGLTPFSGYYASEPSMVNVGTAVYYNLRINKFDLPIQSKVSYNPVLKSTWYTIGITFPSF